MTVLTDVAVIAGLILDIMDMYAVRGVKVTLADLDAEIKRQQDRRDAINEKLGI